MSAEITITIKQTNGEKQIFDLCIQADLTVMDLKVKIKEVMQIPENRQNLIYKGHILFDNKKLEDYHITDNDTVLLVEKINEPARQSSTVPNLNLQSGVGAPGQINYNLLRQPMGGGNVNLDQLEAIMQRPEIAGAMTDMLNDPNVINAMLENPQIKPLVDGNPFLREQLSNPEFLRSLFSPENLRMMRQLQEGGMNMMNNPMMNNPFGGFNMFGGMPANNPNAQSGNNNPGNMNANPMMNPFMFNPYMFNPMMMNNPFLNANMPAMNNMNNNLTDEQLKEKYKDQIQQLKEMGFDNEENNLKALAKSNGNLEAAVERLVSNNF